jgi:hypothetical protein
VSLRRVWVSRLQSIYPCDRLCLRSRIFREITYIILIITIFDFVSASGQSNFELTGTVSRRINPSVCVAILRTALFWGPLNVRLNGISGVEEYEC